MVRRRRRQACRARLAVLALTVGLRLAAISLVRVWLRRAACAGTVAAAGRAVRDVSVARIAMSAVAVVTLAALLLLLALLLGVFFLLLEAADYLVEGGAAQVVGVEGLVFFEGLHASADLVPGVGGEDGGVEVFDFGAQRVDCAALVAFGLVLVVFGAADDFFEEPVEYQREGVAVNGDCTAISVHYG